MAKIICFSSYKGGVGKTTACMNIGGVLALEEHKVCLIDLDPQCNLSTAFNIEITPDKLGVRFLLTDDRFGLNATSYRRGEYLDLCPADPDMTNLEHELLLTPNGRSRLKKKVENCTDYEYILIDCPPSIGGFTQSALVASDEVIIPVDVGFFSIDGLSRMLTVIDQVRDDSNPNLKLSGVLLNKYDARTTLSSQCADIIKSQKIPMFNTAIRISVDIIRAQMDRIPVSAYSPNSNPDLDYRSLITEYLSSTKTSQSSGGQVIPMRKRSNG